MELPVLADFGYQLLMLAPDAGHQRRALHQALPDSLSQCLFMLGLGRDIDPSDKDPGAPDPGLPPMPRAG